MAPKPQRLSSLVCWTIEVKLSASNIAGNRPMPFLTSQTANLTAPSTGFSHDERGGKDASLHGSLRCAIAHSSLGSCARVSLVTGKSPSKGFIDYLSSVRLTNTRVLHIGLKHRKQGTCISLTLGTDNVRFLHSSERAL
jgi:hypothetical protein